jgi:hypothetical protein
MNTETLKACLRILFAAPYVALGLLLPGDPWPEADHPCYEDARLAPYTVAVAVLTAAPVAFVRQGRRYVERPARPGEPVYVKRGRRYVPHNLSVRP